MKLYDFELWTYKKWITFIPTVEVRIDTPVYVKKNIDITLSIFIWHFRWRFIKESEDKK